MRKPELIPIGDAALAILAVAVFIPGVAQAAGAGVVTAKSRYGQDAVSAPVRSGGNGYQVRLPGGTWVDCRRDCGQTLREETVDFWQTMRERGGRR